MGDPYINSDCDEIFRIINCRPKTTGVPRVFIRISHFLRHPNAHNRNWELYLCQVNGTFVRFLFCQYIMTVIALHYLKYNFSTTDVSVKWIAVLCNLHVMNWRNVAVQNW